MSTADDLYEYQSEPHRYRGKRDGSRGRGRNDRDSRSKHSQKSSRDSGFSEEADVDPNFISLMITVFRNGDEFDKGSRISVTRRNFKHWLVLLDHIGERTKFEEPVNRLYTTDGREMKGFRDLEDDGRYVCVGTSRFRAVRYGKEQQKWNTKRTLTKRELRALDSPESVEIFLKKQGFQAKTDKEVFYDYHRGSESSDFDLRGEYKFLSEKRANERHKREGERSKSKSRSFGSNRSSKRSDGSKKQRYPGSHDRGSKSKRFYDSQARRQNTRSTKRSRSHSPYAYYTYYDSDY